MMNGDVRVTARTIRTKAGTTHTVYRARGDMFHSLDQLAEQLGTDAR